METGNEGEPFYTGLEICCDLLLRLAQWKVSGLSQGQTLVSHLRGGHACR